MIVLPKENEHKKVSLEKQLEELNDMKNVLLSSKSTINLDYSLNIINNQIKIVEEKIKEKTLFTGNQEEEVFDTEKYAEKAKSRKQ